MPTQKTFFLTPIFTFIMMTNYLFASGTNNSSGGIGILVHINAKKGIPQNIQQQHQIDNNTFYAAADTIGQFDKVIKKGKLGRRLGIGSLWALGIPFVFFLSLPAAIAALILRRQVKKTNPENRDSKIGMLFALITLAGILTIGALFGLILIITGGVL